MKSGERSARGSDKVESPTSEFEESGSERLKPVVSLVVPAYNEAAILEANLRRLCEYMESLEPEYYWEIVLINDGSNDATGDLAEAFAKSRDNVRVFHHIRNFGLGQAFKFAFAKCRGDYIVTLDIDLSYAPEHIGALLARIRETKAKVVLASPYMKGGQISNVPALRRTMSIWANRFLSWFAKGHLSTLTCMVRAYDGRFIRSLHLRALGMEVMPETVYKTMILRGRIEEIPAHLDWSLQNAAGQQRKSSMRMLRHVVSTMLSGFIFRPFMFFVVPGLALLIFSLYTNFWALAHFFTELGKQPENLSTVAERISMALAAAYNQYPYTYLVGLLSLMLAIQLIGLGIQALQSKNYFEELFHLTSRVYRLEQERKDGN